MSTETRPSLRALRRSRGDRVLGGVCGGLARAIGLDTALTFRTEAGAAGAVNLLLEWEKTRVTIPVTPGK